VTRSLSDVARGPLVLYNLLPSLLDETRRGSAGRAHAAPITVPRMSDALDSDGPSLDGGEAIATASPERGEGKRSRLFISSPDQPRLRRAGDVVSLVVGLVLLILNASFAAEFTQLEESIVGVVSALPTWAHEIFAVSYALAALFAIWLVVAAVVNRRWDILGYLILSVVLAMVVGLVLARLIDGAWPIVLPELGGAEAVARFPVIRVAAVTAVVFTASPHIARPVRWLGWVVISLVAVSSIGLGLGLPTDAVGAIGLGIAAAGGVLLLLGSPAGYPRTEDVKVQLAAMGLVSRDLAPGTVQTWGARTLLGTDQDGRSLIVKVYGPDARDAQVGARAWRFLWYRDTGPSLPWSRLQQVEHEALVTVLAKRAGVGCPEVVVAATTENGDAILVTDRRGVSLTETDPNRLSDEILAALWVEVGKLHGADISHGALNATSVRLDGGEPVITGFQAGSLSAGEARIGIDVAELLVSLAAMVGVKRSVQAAKAGVGDVALAASVPYLQLPAISSTTRRAVDKAGKLVKEVRNAVAEATGVEKPEPEKLRRITLRDVASTALITLLAYFIIKQFAGIDFSEVWQSLQGAKWGWVIAALVTAQLILVPNATSLMSVVRVPIPLRPTIILQSAIQFVGFAVPSTVGRVATNVAYLSKFGLTPTAAVTQGAVDSFSAFLVQVAILLVGFAFGDVSFGFSAGSSSENWGLVLLIAVAVVVAGVIVVVAVESLRTRVLKILGEARHALSVLIEEPRRAVVLFSSNFASQLVLAVTMWLSVMAFGGDIGLGAALAVVVGAVLLGGLAPTPGGIGVQEAVLVAGLVGLGVSSSEATAAAIIYRIVTFFLPPAWGLVSLRWLQRNDYV
jgi:uncharacterized protein (TIRG00374 family)